MYAALRWSKTLPPGFDELLKKLTLLGRQVLDARKLEVKEGLADCRLPSGTLDGKKLRERWFPQLANDVFISHSHADEGAALMLAGLMSVRGLDVFVDSALWGYAPDLLREIDEDFCKLPDGNFSYALRNQTTAHVHAMLTSALASAIDETECLIFVASEESLQLHGGLEWTRSPWLFTELETVLRVERWNPRSRMATASMRKSLQESIMVHPIPTNGLVELPSETLLEWFKATRTRGGPETLDDLYELVGIAPARP